MTIRAIFFGTPDFAVPSLRALDASTEIDLVGVLTQPDRPAGRGQKLRPSPVKETALEMGLEVCSPESLKSPEVLPWLKSKAPDVIAVTAYGGFVGKAIRKLPPLECINLHPSLLPRYRGAAPIHWAIINGDPYTGNSTMYLDAGWDNGDVIYQEEEPILKDDDYASLANRLAEKGAHLLVQSILDAAAGNAPRMPQPEDGVVMAPMISNEDARIRWDHPGDSIHNLVRGLHPIPGAFTEYEGERWKIHRTEVIHERPTAAPGKILTTAFNTIRVAAADSVIEILQLQPAGKKAMSAADYLRGHSVEPGSHCA